MEETRLPQAQSQNAAEDDYRLMQAIAARDATALEQLYDRHGGIVYALGFRVLGDWMEAEALVVDVFWELWHRPDRYDPARGSPRAFIITLARSRALDRRRTQHRAAFDAEVPLSADGAAEAGPEAASAGPTAADPLDQSIAAEQQQRMAAVLAELPPEQRRVVELAFFDGLSHSQIAEREGITLGTAKSRIRRGLIRLRDLLRIQYEKGMLP